MTFLFASGHVVDFILALTAVEAVAVFLMHQRRNEILGNLLAGGCLLVALRLALTGSWWGWIALCLLASLVAHLADLRRRST